MRFRSEGRRRTARWLIATVFVAFTALLSASAALASTWTTGDIFVGTESGNYSVFSNTGVFKEIINGGSGYTTGCAFTNDQSSLFTTFFSTGQVQAFATPHPHPVSTFVSGLPTPESVVFDKAGHVFVGTLGNGIQMYASATNNTLIKTIVPGRRVDWIDLAADQDTILYTDEGSVIHRASVATGGSLPDFAFNGGQYALRILPDGSVLVANNSNILRYNAAGTLIQTYDDATDNNWFALNLDPNGTSFWSADYQTSNVVKFNIATGAIEGSFNAGAPGNTFGLCLKGEITVGGGDTTKPTCQLTATGTNSSGQKYIQITVQDTGSGLQSIVVVQSTNADTVVPPFTAGTTSPVVVTSTKIDQSLGATVKLHVTDVAGNVTDCDPVLTTTVREAGQPASDTYRGLAQAESKLTITNGNPGVASLDVSVNGTVFRVNGLKDGAVKTLDVSSAMHAGNDNTITVTSRGQPGASAFVVISD